MLQKRSTLFFCFECKKAFKNVPMLPRQIMELKNQVKDLKNKVEDMKSEIKIIKETKATTQEEGKNDTQETKEMAIMVSELQERQGREKNLIVLNFEEPKGQNRQERKEEDNNV
ncbi:hypothetical protein JTB14_004207 [Gonioctena quinquepunctata]|nr:hypothetical protein JTB14_004207 [Gonioctena quinquepunctata]